MNIEQNKPLKNLNTFGIASVAKYYVAVDSEDKIKELLNDPVFKNSKRIILGGGSNVLFTKDFDGLVVHVLNKGKTVKEDGELIYVNAKAGEIWTDFVEYCVENNYCGVENLVDIPGTVGATPIQNVGAYGVETKDVFHELEAINIQTREIEKFTLTECKFGYRDSIFKNELKDKYIITSVTYKLASKPKLNTSYGDIQKKLEERVKDKNYSIKDVYEIVSEIRGEKLPDPKDLGNAGSFFKNPIVSRDVLASLQQKYPEIPSFDVDDQSVKIPAAWFLDNAGWKGKKTGNVGSYEKQPIIIVNFGNAAGDEIFAFSEEIINDIKEKYGVQLEREVNVY